MSLTRTAHGTALPALTPVQWSLAAWGVGGVSLVLVNPVVRLGIQCAGILAEHGLTTLQGVAVVPWLAFMLYTEAWRGFHKQFSPRVVLRAVRIAESGRTLPALLAPAACMGLVFATRKRLVISWMLIAMIVTLVVGVQLLPPGWRAVVDIGVVVGLAAGTLSLWWHAVRALQGTLPDMPSDLPWEAAP